MEELLLGVHSNLKADPLATAMRLYFLSARVLRGRKNQHKKRAADPMPKLFLIRAQAPVKTEIQGQVRSQAGAWERGKNRFSSDDG